MSRSSKTEFRAGLVVFVALAGYAAFVVIAGGGPGFLAPQRTIDVLFRDGQGIQTGALVRVAGINAGRVTAVDLADAEGQLRARVRISITARLAARLRQDVKITIQSGLTGTTCVNIVGSGRSDVALVPGQVVEGIETSFFDPVLEQVGLGPVERNHLSHTIAQVRETVDASGPRLNQILGNLQDATNGLRETADNVRPSLETAAARVDQIAKRLDDAKLDETLKKADALLSESQALVSENRPLLQSTMTNVRDLVASSGPKAQNLIDSLSGTRVRVDHLLTQAAFVANQSSDLLAQNRATLDRTLSNVKDTSDYSVRLVQKLYGNPFYLSPFYKPTKEDIRAQEFYDMANSFLIGSKELNDAVARLQNLRNAKSLNQMSPEEKKSYDQLFQRAWTLQTTLEQASRQFSEGLKQTITR